MHTPRPTDRITEKPVLSGWRFRLHEIIFEAETPAGKAFDVVLIICILLSVVLVMLDSIASVREEHGVLLLAGEWFFTILFSIEYIARLLCVGRPLRYAGSFFGVVDLLAVLPTYIALLIPGTRYLTVVRVLRVLRIFRVLKLAAYLNEATTLLEAFRSGRRKIIVFLLAILTLVVILGSFMYMIEGVENGFTSIPVSVYWAIVTMTTVGYGDISPQTALGQTIASFIMILGYAIIAVPGGIIGAELTQKASKVSTEACPRCAAQGHDTDAKHCKYCGAKL
ncbi:MAG: ion transporter [Candidatus Sumerlaeota bacterium]